MITFSVGALHSAGQFIALFAWLIDLVDPLPDQTSDDDVVSYVRRVSTLIVKNFHTLCIFFCHTSKCGLANFLEWGRE